MRALIEVVAPTPEAALSSQSETMTFSIRPHLPIDRASQCECY